MRTRRGRGSAPATCRRAPSRMLLEPLERLPVPLGALSQDAVRDHVLDHRAAPPLLPLGDVREMDLDDRPPEELDGVADRVAVVRPRTRVEDDPVRPAPRVVAPVDELALVVRLEAADGDVECPRPLVDPRLELVVGEAAVESRIAVRKCVQVRSVDDGGAHGASLLPLARTTLF